MTEITGDSMSQALLRRFQKLRGLPPKQLIGVLQHKTDRLQRSLRQEIRVRLIRRLWPGAGHRRLLDLQTNIHFFGLEEWRGRNQELGRVLRELEGFSAEEVVHSAGHRCAHVFDLLGSGPVDLGNTIDWHRDFKSGTRWELKYFKRIKEIELGDASDIKVPWELSRCYHFAPLGVAYWLTRDEKYAREFIGECLDWIEHNPPYCGVNWHCAMEVAIRAINWIWGYYFFQESACFDAPTRSRLASSLAMHGEYIWNNLEFDKRVVGGRYIRHNGNHYVADLVGLIYLGVVLPGNQASRWLRWGLKELDLEMQTQVLADGVHWELSPSYHRLVLELILPAVILCTQNNIAVPENLRGVCKAMAEYTMHYLKPDGRCPLVRDADDGRVSIFENRDYRDHRHLLALAGVFFDREDFVARAGGISTDVVWMMGQLGVEKARNMTVRPLPLPSRAFSQAGFYVLRDSDEVHVFVACADVGMKGSYGGHAHNDCLSFELYCGGTTFITDCGTFIYSGDPAARNHFRSTASHNTARIDGAEMNRFEETELFGMQNDAKPKVLEWRTEPEFDYLLAEHYGYARLPSPVVHQRSFRLDRSSKSLFLEDRFEGGGQHIFELFFHFFPGVQLEQVGELMFRARAAAATILLRFSGGPGWSTKLEESWVSEGYGRRQRAWRIVLAANQTAPAAVATEIAFGLEAKRGEPAAEVACERAGTSKFFAKPVT